MIKSSEPVFAVADVRATITYYRNVLGFESEWLWGDPPTFGGVCWGRIQVMFCLDPTLQSKVQGHQQFFRLDNVQELYDRHEAAGATIVCAI
ncbi:MAG TPA: VOC family protein, partial [Tepidisphaeraceae bacterium]|nr:VOC family protein [Tepidisphaeraceae bacterium]